MYELVALKVVEVQGISLKGIGVFCPFHFYSTVPEQLNQVVDIADIGNVVDGHLLACQQGGTDYLQCLVFGTLWCDFATQGIASLNDE